MFLIEFVIEHYHSKSQRPINAPSETDPLPLPLYSGMEDAVQVSRRTPQKSAWGKYAATT